MGERRMRLSERDRRLLAWCGEQYTVRFDLLAMVMVSDDPATRARRRVTRQAVAKRVRDWKSEGLVDTRTIAAREPATG